MKERTSNQLNFQRNIADNNVIINSDCIFFFENNFFHKKIFSLETVPKYLTALIQIFWRESYLQVYYDNNCIGLQCLLITPLSNDYIRPFGEWTYISLSFISAIYAPVRKYDRAGSVIPSHAKRSAMS
jgi:hypothetical protein